MENAPENSGSEPVIIGVGETCEPTPENLESASSLVELMVAAAQAALQDSGVADAVLGQLDVLAVVRTFADSTPMYPNPFGTVGNYPRAVASKLGASPASAVYSTAGGNSPQQLVTEYAGRIAQGEMDMVLLVGGEALATTKQAMKTGIKLDWSDETGGQIEDRGLGVDSLIDRQQIDNGLATAPPMYGIFENARRRERGESLQDYARCMGELFAGFSRVAAEHPAAMFPEAYSAEALAEVSDSNPMVATPYSRHLVSKDAVNQSAAVLLTNRKTAEILGIPEDRLVYPLTGSNVYDRYIVQRPDLARSQALRIAYDAVFREAGISPQEVAAMDLYSCFPIAVYDACEAMGIEPDGERVTLTGGLPFFGGAGNNYAMHSIVNVVDQLRDIPGGYGLVGANGGVLSKHSVGLYSRDCPAEGFLRCDDEALQARADAIEVVPTDLHPNGRATIESYSVTYKGGEPATAFIVGRTEKGARFIAHSDPEDRETPISMHNEDPMGKTVYVTAKGPGTRFTFDHRTTERLIPFRPRSLDGNFRYCKLHRNGMVLEVAINRPDVKNCLNPMANYELEAVFDLFEQDPGLRVAILTGTGDDAFCAGNDLKAGEAVWVPESGFAGLTHRKNRHKPVIAAVNGLAMGGGMEIALACDLIVASEEAVFALPEVKVGLIAGAGGIQRLSRQIPSKQAMEILLLGDSVSADQGREFGFVNRVVPQGAVMATARELADKLLAVSPTSIHCTLQTVDETEHIGDTVDAVRHPTRAINRLLTSQDMQEGISAFAQKRKPVWKGR